jgi:meiotically up-regulated gene 157 (Mug157) protein
MSAPFPSRRPPPDQRRFHSATVEQLLATVAAGIADPELAWLWHNCFPNTLDTTVTPGRDAAGRPDTFVITGDIGAMWLRDSTAQVWPYLTLAREDAGLRDLLAGVVRRQAACVRLDPYANAFYRDPVFGEWRDDHTEMRPGVHERKWEVDSLLYFFRLSHGCWQLAGDTSACDADWLRVVELALATLRAEQRADSPYRFQRTCNFGDSLANAGRGDPARACGLIRGAFRPSDDQTKLPYHVASNAMAVPGLRNLAQLLVHLGHSAVAAEAQTLADEVAAALAAHAVVAHRTFGEIWAYEVDGFGGAYLMDDANVPALLALPYLGFCAKDDPRYLRTRAFCLSAANPYFATGRAASGIGSPHTGPGTIWPIGLTMQALTATDDAEILTCLRALKSTHAATGFMHESFACDDAARFTRPWFAWANTLFGELILTLHRDRPYLLTRPL